MHRKNLPALNNYRQLRVTLTEETNNRWTIRAQVKPLWAAWDERYVVLYETFNHTLETGDLTDVYRLLVRQLQRELEDAEPREQQHA